MIGCQVEPKTKQRNNKESTMFPQQYHKSLTTNGYEKKEKRKPYNTRNYNNNSNLLKGAMVVVELVKEFEIVWLRRPVG